MFKSKKWSENRAANLISFDFFARLPSLRSPEGNCQDPYKIREVRIGTGGVGVTDSLKGISETHPIGGMFWICTSYTTSGYLHPFKVSSRVYL